MQIATCVSSGGCLISPLPVSFSISRFLSLFVARGGGSRLPSRSSWASYSAIQASCSEGVAIGLRRAQVRDGARRRGRKARPPADRVDLALRERAMECGKQRFRGLVLEREEIGLVLRAFGVVVARGGDGYHGSLRASVEYPGSSLRGSPRRFACAFTSRWKRASYSAALAGKRRAQTSTLAPCRSRCAR